MGEHTRSAPIGSVVNTHANGDHWYGNSLVPSAAEIIASSATARSGRCP